MGPTPSPQNADRVIEALRAFGLETATLDPLLFVNPRSLVRFGLPPFRIELMTAIDGVDFDRCRARAAVFDVEAVSVPVISFEDLKRNKRAAGRHKDLNDLENLP